VKNGFIAQIRQWHNHFLSLGSIVLEREDMVLCHVKIGLGKHLIT
jgi:hypothetical protein